MILRHLTLIVLFASGLVAGDATKPSTRIDWTATATAPGYAAATAQAPDYTNKALWPALKGSEPFVTQTWSKGRLLVWAQPGKKGGYKDGLDVLDPANWLEDGKPANALWDAETDLLLPECATPYEVALRRAVPGKGGYWEGAPMQTMRHLTVGSGAYFNTGGDGIGRKHFGNVWVKRGGRVGAQSSTTFLGKAFTFFRNDNGRSADQPRNQTNYTLVSQYFSFDKVPEASVEFLGMLSVLDEFKVNGGMVVVGQDSQLQPGRSAEPEIGKDGALALLDGARFGNWINTLDKPDLTCSGRIVGGLPDRPLTRDAVLTLTFKNHTNADYTGPAPMMNRKDIRQLPRRVPSLLLKPGAEVAVHAAPGSAATLSLAWSGNTGISEGWRMPPGSWQETETLGKNPAEKDRFDWLDALPKGFDIYLSQGARISGVRCEFLRAGGLMLQDVGQKAGVQVLFGKDCLAKGDALFSVVTLKGRTW